MVLESVKNDMEEANCSTRILRILFHEEQVLWYLLRQECNLLLVCMFCLYWCDFEQEQNSKNWLRDHIQCPFFCGEHLLEAKLLSFESHFIDELVDDFRIGLHWHPVLVVGLLHFLFKDFYY